MIDQYVGLGLSHTLLFLFFYYFISRLHSVMYTLFIYPSLI